MRLLRLFCLALVGVSSAADARGGEPGDADRAVRELAATIDRHIARGWEEAGITPAPPADDAEFARRVYLDLAGRIPSVGELRAFLADDRPDKRDRLVTELLSGPRYVTHFAGLWRSWLVPELDNDFITRLQVSGFDDWIRGQLLEDVPYDRMVRDILTTPLPDTGDGRPAPRFIQGQQKPSPLGFYTAKESKPENLAAASSRLFLGVKLECAQCHDHPFATWEQDQFWSLAAFFADEKKEIAVPDQDKTVPAAFIDGTQPNWAEKAEPREVLADWITAKDNPYFARALVNRMWAQFLGRGFIDPVDEIVGGQESASHPELLDEIAEQFKEQNYDVKFLIRAIVASRAYQLSSLRTDPEQDDPPLFARMPLRGLSAEQLYDSVLEATGYRGPASDPTGVIRPTGNPRDEFLRTFSRSADAADAETSILQALKLMNGGIVRDATSLENSETLTAVADNPFMSTAERVETLYLAALSREPTEAERERMMAHVSQADTEKEGLADVFWVLLNSGEFCLNH